MKITETCYDIFCVWCGNKVEIVHKNTLFFPFQISCPSCGMQRTQSFETKEEAITDYQQIDRPVII